ncbi:hypothetical protein VNO80_15628 [Phaseolus coccineus]|uniref:Uncharacterized protein n=1 Tax=Phaseolus coccineus TaxID=3886 RepID=A0AAN9R761_PHACN
MIPSRSSVPGRYGSLGGDRYCGSSGVPGIGGSKQSMHPPPHGDLGGGGHSTTAAGGGIGGGGEGGGGDDGIGGGGEGGSGHFISGGGGGGGSSHSLHIKRGTWSFPTAEVVCVVVANAVDDRRKIMEENVKRRGRLAMLLNWKWL